MSIGLVQSKLEISSLYNNVDYSGQRYLEDMRN